MCVDVCVTVSVTDCDSIHHTALRVLSNHATKFFRIDTRCVTDTAARLEDAALALFHARGFDAVSCADIAAAAGVSERTFFRHFAHKEDVLLRDHSARLALLEVSLREPSRNVAERLGAALAAVMSDVNDPTVALRGRLLAVTPALRRRSVELQIQWEDTIAAALEPDLGPTEAALVAAAAVACARSVLVRSAEDEQYVDVRTALQDAFRALGVLIAE